MKKHLILNILLFFFISLKSTSQETSTFRITPEFNDSEDSSIILSQMKANGVSSNYKIYKINEQSVIYNEFVMGEIDSKEYLDKLEYIEKLNSEISKQFGPLEKKKQDLKLCVYLIDKYLNSDEKLEVKKNILLESHKLAVKNNVLYIKTEDFRDLEIYREDYKGNFIKPNTSDLKFIKDYINRIIEEIPNPEKSNLGIEYLSAYESLEKISKKVPGLVKSEIESERKAIVVSNKKEDLKTFSGTFQMLEEVYILNSNIEAPKINKSFIENEIIEKGVLNEFRKFYDERNVFSEGYLIQDVITKQQYYIPKGDWYGFRSLVRVCENESELKTMLKNLGYKIYQKESYTNLNRKYYKSFINTKTAEIELKTDDNGNFYLFEPLKEDKKYLEKFDANYLKINNLISKIPSHSKVLANYLNIYDLKRSLTPVSVLNDWKKATLLAKPIADELLKIRSEYAFIYDFQELKTNNVTDFVGYCAYSAKILGLL